MRIILALLAILAVSTVTAAQGGGPGADPNLSPGVYAVKENQIGNSTTYAVLSSAGNGSDLLYATFTGAGGTGEQLDSGTVTAVNGGYQFNSGLGGGSGVIQHVSGQKWAWMNNTTGAGGTMKRQ